jgi:5-(carboxyamino)imidazole ribonucleotide synthase
MTVVGFVGAGQLARMAQQAAIPLGIHLRLLAETPDDSAAQVTPDVVVGDYRSLEDLLAFAKGCDVVTFDHELTDPAHLAALEEAGVPLVPTPAAKRFAQDKRYQRETLSALGLPVPAHRGVESLADVETLAAQTGWPVVLKAVRGGYDGRGVWVVETIDEAATVLTLAAATELLVEAFVPIERELAVMVARSPAGATAVYPVVETVQSNGICNEVIAPATVSPQVAVAARDLAARIADAMGATGILAVELFLTADGLLLNEVAARPHNSGHWTIDAAATSQFENHLRAVANLPLGAADALAPVSVMVNILGREDGSDPADLLPHALSDPGAHVHLYGKAPRPGRKLGHVTVCGSVEHEVRARARRAAAALGQEIT